MYDHIKAPTPAVFNIESVLKANYQLSPHVHFENICDPKRMKVLGPIASELFDAQMAVMGALREFHFVYATGAGQAPFHYLAGLYGALEKRFSELKILLRKYNKQPEVVAYYLKAETVLGQSLWDMMRADFLVMEPTFAARRADDVARYPHFDMWEPLEIDWDVVAKRYKEGK